MNFNALEFDDDGSKIVGYIVFCTHIKAVVSESMLLTNFQSSYSLSTFGVGVEGTFGNTKYFGEMYDFFCSLIRGFGDIVVQDVFRNVAITVVFTLKDNDGGAAEGERDSRIKRRQWQFDLSLS